MGISCGRQSGSCGLRATYEMVKRPLLRCRMRPSWLAYTMMRSARVSSLKSEVPTTPGVRLNASIFGYRFATSRAWRMIASSLLLYRKPRPIGPSVVVLRRSKCDWSARSPVLEVYITRASAPGKSAIRSSSGRSFCVRSAWTR